MNKEEFELLESALVCVAAMILGNICVAAGVIIGATPPGLAFLCGGWLLLWMSLAHVSPGPAKKWWNNTIGRTGRTVEKTFSERRESLYGGEGV